MKIPITDDIKVRFFADSRSMDLEKRLNKFLREHKGCTILETDHSSNEYHFSVIIYYREAD